MALEARILVRRARAGRARDRPSLGDGHAQRRRGALRDRGRPIDRRRPPAAAGAAAEGRAARCRHRPGRGVHALGTRMVADLLESTAGRCCCSAPGRPAPDVRRPRRLRAAAGGGALHCDGERARRRGPGAARPVCTAPAAADRGRRPVLDGGDERHRARARRRRRRERPARAGRSAARSHSPDRAGCASVGLRIAETADAKPLGALVLGARPGVGRPGRAGRQRYIEALVSSRGDGGRGIAADLVCRAVAETRAAGVGLLRVDCWCRAPRLWRGTSATAPAAATYALDGCTPVLSSLG